MTRTFVRLVGLAFLGAALVPVVTVTCDRWSVHRAFSPGFLFELGVSALALAAALGFYAVLRKYQSRVDANAREQADFLSAFPVQYADLAIFGAAALSLFLELAVIRWQGTVFEFFAFYKNFSLLCCFAGLGLGYALAGSDRIPAVAQKRERQPLARGKAPVRRDGIRTDADDSGAHLGETIVAPLKGACLERTPRGSVLGIEVQHERLFADQVS